MACTVSTISSIAGCAGDEGGIERSFMCNLTDIASVTLTSGVISNFTMTSTSQWKQLTYDQDDTAYFNQTGARTNGRFSATQAAFLKFKGLSAAYTTAANAVKDCCAVVVIHVLSNGTRLVQGIELDSSAVGLFKVSRVETRVTPSLQSDTGANQSRMEFLIEGTTNDFAPTTDLTDTEILAL